jgi:hypothetical protein
VKPTAKKGEDMNWSFSRVVEVEVLWGLKENGEEIKWTVDFEMLTVRDRMRLDTAFLTGKSSEVALIVYELVCEKVKGLRSSEVQREDGRAWTDGSVEANKELFAYDFPFGAAFVEKVFVNYQKEIDSRLGKLSTP